MKKILLFIAVFLLTACTDTWSETAPDGTKLSSAMPECREKAGRSVRHQFRFHQIETYLPGTTDSRRDIERRETAMCLQNKGFKLRREFR